MTGRKWSLDLALDVAESIQRALIGTCARVEIVGSLRREKPMVHDIDILLIPISAGKMAQTLQGLADAGTLRLAPKIIKLTCRGIPVDVYVADPETWGVLQMIRTGSKEHNMWMIQEAKKVGWKIHAEGWLESPTGDRVTCMREHDVFVTVGIPYKAPTARD